MADIYYLGHACFRLRGRDGIVLCDPYDRSVGLDIGRPTAHIVTVSHAHPGHSHTVAVRPVRDQVFQIEGPGEYEVRGVFITGVRTYHDKDQGATLGTNTVYVIRLDDVIYCHLGDLGHDLTQSQLEDIGNVDVLFVPVGGGETIGPAEAAGVISQIEPRVVIPMHYAIPHLPERGLAPLEAFTEELGVKDSSLQEKVSLSPSSLPAEGTEARIILMQPTVG